MATILYKYNSRLPYFVSFVMLIISGIIAFSIKYKHQGTEPNLSKYIFQIKTGVNLTLKSISLLSLMFIGFVLAATRLVYSQNINQPLLLKTGLGLERMGIVMSISSLGAAAVSVVSYKLIKNLGDLKSLLLAITAPALIMIILSQTIGPAGAGWVILFYITMAFKDPLLSGLRQKLINSEHRSTMASTNSFLISVLGAIIMPLWGGVIDSSGMVNTLISLGIFTLMSLFGVMAYIKAKSKLN